MKKSFFTLLLVLFAAPVFAQTAEEKINCDEAVSNADMKQCAANTLDKNDKELEELLVLIKAQQFVDTSNFPEDGKEIIKRLENSQKAWVKFREANCRLDSIDMLNGSGEGLLYLGCMGRMSTERAKELKSIFNMK